MAQRYVVQGSGVAWRVVDTSNDRVVGDFKTETNAARYAFYMNARQRDAGGFPLRAA